VNPTLGELTVCTQKVTLSATGMCAVVWRPMAGVGVDCQSSDGLISPGETLVISFTPAMNKVKLSFGTFIAGTKGTVKVKMNSPIGTRRRQAEETLDIDANPFVINRTEIAGLEITAQEGSKFDLRTIESVQMTIVTMPLESSTSVIDTTAPANSTSENTTDTTTAPLEKGFIENLQDGFAGQNNVYLGGFIAVIILIVIIIVAVVVVVIKIRQNKEARKTLYNAYGQGKPMQSFETVTAKPSTALGEDSEDEPLGILSTPTAASVNMGSGVGDASMTHGDDDAPRVGIKVEPLTDSEDS
jgi:hypothetical protein